MKQGRPPESRWHSHLSLILLKTKHTRKRRLQSVVEMPIIKLISLVNESEIRFNNIALSHLLIRGHWKILVQQPRVILSASEVSPFQMQYHLRK
jgi:hypothetical protein